MRRVLALAFFLCFPVGLWGQFVSSTHILPVVAKLKGQVGTDWVSDVSVSNLGENTATLRFYFFPEAHDNLFPPPFQKEVSLGPAQTRTFADVLGSLFPLAGNNVKGILLVTSQGQPLAVSSRTYNNANPDRTYGQTVPPAGIAVVWGGGKAVLAGVRQDARFRTNIGVVNLSMGVPSPPRLKVKIRILSELGAPIREVTKEVESLSLRQWGLPELGVTSLATGRVEVSIAPEDPNYNPCFVRPEGNLDLPGGTFIAYFSKVDQSSGDAEFGLGQLDWSAYSSCPQPPGGNPCQ